MSYIPRDFAHVRPGEFVLDPNGKPWKMLGRDAQGVVLIDQAGEQARGPAQGPVLVWDGAMQEAIAVVQNVLGGTVVADSSLTR